MSVPERGIVKTTCPYCGVGCGVNVQTDGNDIFRVSGDEHHPANYGRLCSKGSALAETLGIEGRLLYPQINGVQSDWETALRRVADGFNNIIRTYGPAAVAFYVSGQLLTEDYYVANKLMKGFLGSANIDTNSRLCMSSAVAGYKRAFGSDTVPCDYTDLEQTDLLILVGSNLAWCHPVLYQRIVQAKKNNPLYKVVVVDPRATPTCDIADMHLAIKPGTDTLLFNGLLEYLYRNECIDHEFVSKHTDGLHECITEAQRSAADTGTVAAACGLPEAELTKFYRWFAESRKTVTAYSMGVNQSSCGTDKVNSIINCHLLTGRLGKTGMGPFSITGQPNAMGGREVGGLSNQLAAHMDFGEADNVNRVKRFWHAQNMADKPGLMAVDMFEAIADGRIKAVWIIATNPVVSLPDANRVRQALEKCELVVVSDCVADTDTSEYADILLPAAAWGEKEGVVTNSERRISRQRAFRAPPGDARPDWWIISEVAKRMGYGEWFNYASVADVFREHAALSGFENDGARDFDIGALQNIGNEEYDSLLHFKWPVSTAEQRQHESCARFFSDGQFYTGNRKARFIPIVPAAPAGKTNSEFPLILNTGRIRDHWHTMTRTATAARLSVHTAEPLMQVHPFDAEQLALQDGGIAELENRRGKVLVRVQCSTAVQKGSVFVPIHWNKQYANNAGIGALIAPVVDPVSGEPEFKYTPVKATPFQAAWYAFVYSRRPLPCRISDYWVKVKTKNCWRYEMAQAYTSIAKTRIDWKNQLHDWLQIKNDNCEWIEYQDAANNDYRVAVVIGDKLEACAFISGSNSLPERSWLAGLFEQDSLDTSARYSLLAGRSANQRDDTGRTVCSCFGVGSNTIRQAVCSKNLFSVEAIGRELRAGTNCGSCIPELKAIILEAQNMNKEDAA